jgi:excisionase family DNA binding protein
MVSEKWVLTVQETAQVMQLSRNSVYAAVLRGEIPHIKIGKRILIPRKALERLMDGGNGKV